MSTQAQAPVGSRWQYKGDTRVFIVIARKPFGIIDTKQEDKAYFGTTRLRDLLAHAIRLPGSDKRTALNIATSSGWSTKERKMNPLHSIHANVAPVRTYAADLGKLTGKTHHIITIPAGSNAYEMGYRYTTCLDDELDYYVQHGATLVQ